MNFVELTHVVKGVVKGTVLVNLDHVVSIFSLDNGYTRLIYVEVGCFEDVIETYQEVKDRIRGRAG